MIKRELAKDPKLANESWDRFLPQFRKRHLTSAQKSAKKRDRVTQKADVQAVVSTSSEPTASTSNTLAPQPEKSKKKVYTPFPPPQQPRKIDLQLESGEYFLKPAQKEAKVQAERKKRQEEAGERRREERAKAFVAPEEERDRTVDERRTKRKSRDEGGESGEKKKKRKVEDSDEE